MTDEKKDVDRTVARDGYDPIRDEKKPYTFEEFITEAKACLDDYREIWREEPNEYHAGSHTFDEWMATFGRWMSW